MGRPRSFDTDAVVAAARAAFVRTGYVGTSIDDLLRATGLQRASLYSAFGSKRGLFVAALLRRTDPKVDEELLLVALMDVSAGDAEVRAIAADRVRELGADSAAALGRRLLDRAGVSRDVHERSGR